MISILLFLAAISANAGDRMGNGGFVVVPRGGDRTKIELLDYAVFLGHKKKFKMSEELIGNLRKIQKGLIEIGLHEKDVNRFFDTQIFSPSIDWFLETTLPAECKETPTSTQLVQKFSTAEHELIQAGCTMGHTTWLLESIVENPNFTRSDFAEFLIHERMRGWKSAEADRVIMRFLRLVRQARLGIGSLDDSVVLVDSLRAAGQLGFHFRLPHLKKLEK